MSIDNEQFTRTLIYIPIIHTQEDMGALSRSVQEMALRDVTIKSWRHKMRSIARIWDEIEQTIESLSLSYEKVRLYQDGLPVCAREAEIVNELALKGSRNHCLLIKLMERGATLMGTESAELLTQEYTLVQQAVTGHKTPSKTTVDATRDRIRETLLARRDRYIARRINDTLLPGETGVLFIGMLHRPEAELDQDIRIVYPIRRLLDAGGK